MKNSSATQSSGTFRDPQLSPDDRLRVVFETTLGDARLLANGVIPLSVMQVADDCVRWADEQAADAAATYCDMCSLELPDHERDCPKHPDGPEVLPMPRPHADEQGDEVVDDLDPGWMLGDSWEE